MTDIQYSAPDILLDHISSSEFSKWNTLMKVHKEVLRLMTAVAISRASCASYASPQSGAVTGINYKEGRATFTLSGQRTARPSCDCCGQWEVFINDAPGNGLFQMILLAHREGKDVQITGSDSCVPGGNNTERVSSLAVS